MTFGLRQSLKSLARGLASSTATSFFSSSYFSSCLFLRFYLRHSLLARLISRSAFRLFSAFCWVKSFGVPITALFSGCCASPYRTYINYSAETKTHYSKSELTPVLVELRAYVDVFLKVSIRLLLRTLFQIE